MRSALAHEIGRPQEAVGTCGNFGGFGCELVVSFLSAAGICCKGIAKPAQREAGGLRDTHDVPASRDGVAKRVDAAARIKCGAISGGKNDAGSANRSADRSGRDDAHARGAGGLVACTGHNGRANAQTCFRGSFAGNFRAHGRRFVEQRQQAFIDFGALHLDGETDASNFFGAEIGARDGFTNRDAGGTPPILGVLFGPTDLRRSEGLVLFRGGRNEAAAAIYDEGARSSGTNVNPENVDRTSLDKRRCPPRYRERDYRTSLVMRKSGRISKLAYCGRRRSVLYCSLTLTTFLVAVTVSRGMLS